MPDPPTTTSKSAATVVISQMDSQFWALTCRDTLRLILQTLPVPDLARASCVCRLWNSVASDHELITIAFKAPWKLKHVVGKPVSGSFWRDSGIGKFAISHRLVRGDSIASLAVKYSVQVMEIKRLNNMLSDHGIYSRERLLIPISKPDILLSGTCYIELDTNVKREVAVLYLEGGPERKSSHLLKKMSTEQGKRKVVDSLKRTCKLMMGLPYITCLFQMAILGLHSLNFPRTLGGRGKRAWHSF